MALSWPLAIIGMMVGARVGIMILIEGSLRGAIGKFSFRRGTSASPAE
jgi:hypothetical protein